MVQNQKICYRNLPPQNIEELKLWNLVHVDLIDTYVRLVQQQHTGGTMLEIIQVTCFNLYEVTDEFYTTSLCSW